LLLKRTRARRVTPTVHGLDVVYPFMPYRTIVPAALARLDRIVCVSRSTADAVRKKGVSADRSAGVEARSGILVQCPR
jgi:histidinol dehydrogenase